MANLGNIVGILAQQVVDLTHDRAGGRGGSAKDLVSKPKPWDGRGGSAEARHFLAAFHNYAASQGSPLNTYDPTANTWTINEERWIQSVLNLMEGDAHTWALPYLEELRTGAMPFAGLWATFIDHFSRRFTPLNTADSARDTLKKVRQKNSTVAEYTSLFDQYSAQTGWSLVNLRQRYYNGLNDRVKDRLSEIPTPPADLADLRAATQNIDQRWRQHEAEKKGGTITISPSPGTTSDPNAMQVDATHQGTQKPKEAKKDHASYIKSMQGKCYGCGSDKHTKKDGNHKRGVCNHCGKTGHRSPVCFNKYIGKTGSAKAAGTTDGSTSMAKPPSPPATASASTSAPAKTNKTQADLLAKLMKRIEDQDTQIKALKVSF
jgi:hypothetical protein